MIIKLISKQLYFFFFDIKESYLNLLLMSSGIIICIKIIFLQQCQLRVNNVITLELPDQNNLNQVFYFSNRAL